MLAKIGRATQKATDMIAVLPPDAQGKPPALMASHRQIGDFNVAIYRKRMTMDEIGPILMMFGGLIILWALTVPH